MTVPRLAYAALVAVTAILVLTGVAAPLLIYVLLPALALGLIYLVLTN